MAEFIPQQSDTSDCADRPVNGTPSSKYDYIVKSSTGDPDYPAEACTPYLLYNVKAQNLQLDKDIVACQNITAAGTIKASTFNGQINVQSWKGFDITHPNKENHRLRHICAEGPEAGVYIRGTLKDKNVIELPSYWEGLIDPNTITVTLTQIGYSQDLIVDREIPEWGKLIKVRSGSGANVYCFYEVWAARIDGEPLIVEYEGATPADYPGSDKQFSISGYDYDARGDKSTKDIKL